MRQIKNYMRSKRTMRNCQEPVCATLNAWKCMNEFCGCGENSNNRFFAFNKEGEDKVFFFFNMNPDEDNTISIEVDSEETSAEYVVVGGFGFIKNEEANGLWREMRESLDAECVKTLLGGREEAPSGTWRFKTETMAQFNAFMNNPTEEQINILKERLETQCGSEVSSPIIEKVSDNCIIYFTQQSGIYDPRTDELEEVNSDYVNLSKKSVTVPAGTLMKIEHSEDDKDIYFVFYDENETEIDRVASRTPSDNMQYIYYAGEGDIGGYEFERDEDRRGNIVKSSVDIQVFGTAEVLMQVTITVEPEGRGTTNYKKIGVPYQSQRTKMREEQGTGYFKIDGQGKEFTISASPDTSIEKNNFFDWKVNGTWAGQTSDHRIQDDIVITAVFSDSGR